MANRIAFSVVVMMVVFVGCSKTSTVASSPDISPTGTSPTAVQPTTVTDPLPSWNDGPAKQAIVGFVKTTTEQGNANLLAPEDRIATFDQDGTVWVEHPVYSQLYFISDRLAAIAPQHPEWNSKPLFHGLIVGDFSALEKASVQDLEELHNATQMSMPVGDYQNLVRNWMVKAKHVRFDKPYSEMIYQPMIEVMQYLRANGYRTYIVTGGGQEFVRTYAEKLYGIPTEQVIGSALQTEYSYTPSGKSVLMRKSKLLLNNDHAGKPEDIYLFLGKRPHAAFGNSTGDQQMLEYTQDVGGTTLEMLVLHDDAEREYAYGPAQGLPDTHVGKFTQALYNEAKQRGWTVISMKNDWKKIFAWEK